MPLLTRYDTPAGLRDAPAGSRFYDAWHDTVAGLVTLAGPMPGWLDPLRDDAEHVLRRDLSWIGFSRRSLVQNRDDRFAAFARSELVFDDDPEFPGPRPSQPEYFEWRATRRPDGRITKVAFTSETPEYWTDLATYEMDTVVALYRDLVDPAVECADLLDAYGAYDPYNRWNTTDGIVHYVMNANRLGAALSLAQGGAARTGPDGYADARFGMLHATDDYIPRDVGAILRAGHAVAPHAPVGLYIDGWDDTGWTTPDGSPVGDYWTIRRGVPGAVLRVEYEVPEGEGFCVGDIRIGGRRITHGGQLAEHMTVSLPIDVYRRP